MQYAFCCDVYDDILRTGLCERVAPGVVLGMYPVQTQQENKRELTYDISFPLTFFSHVLAGAVLPQDFDGA